MQKSYRGLAFSLIPLCMSTVFIKPEVSAETLDSIQNEPPALVTDPLIRATPELLKRGLWGSISVEVTIDSTGLVDSCIVEKSQNPSFDSLVKCRVDSAVFTPAKENGRAISSVVRFEVNVPQDSLLEKCIRLPPNFTGTVVDTALKITLPKTSILMYYTDTTEDRDINIGFSRYLSLIGNKAGWKYDGKLISGSTDSLGRFSFRLSPVGHFTVSVQSSGYEIGKFRGYISKDEQLQCSYVLKQSSQEPPRDSTYEITVYGKQQFAEKKINIAEEEKHVGFSPFLSNIVQAKAEIRRVPEGPSMMLVRSGCPFDNVYMIAGVPMPAPFHFGGNPYADIDGVMISALPDVKVTINDIAAKRLDASGCIVEANPGKIKYDDGVEKGIYLKGDFSTIGVDLLAAYTAKRDSGDFVQIGYSACNSYMLKYDYFSYRSAVKAKDGIGVPQSYGNATLTGSKSIGAFRCNAFGWFAWDSYNVNKSRIDEEKLFPDNDKPENLSDKGKTFLPWGMGSVKLSKDSSNRSIMIGGAHQFFGTGKQFHSLMTTTRSYLNNGELKVDLDTIVRNPFKLKLSCGVNHDEWNGFLSHQFENSIDTLYSSRGTETGVDLKPSFIKQTGRVTTELDLLASAVKYTKDCQFIGDAGVSSIYAGGNYSTGIYLGRVTSRPDIRGLPDSRFRKKLDHAYIASLPFFFRFKMITKVGIEPYVRYCTNMPRLDPVKQIWDPSGSTPVLAEGADFDFRISPASWAEFSTALNLADTRRLSSKSDSLLSYEWNLPWTIRAGLHLHSRSDRYHLYLDYIRTKGLPYYDLDNKEYEALPDYQSLDMNFQLRTFSSPQRFINKLDFYVTLKNLFSLLGKMNTNARDYYWDENGLRQPIFLGGGRMDIGARFGIKM